MIPRAALAVILAATASIMGAATARPIAASSARAQDDPSLGSRGVVRDLVVSQPLDCVALKDVSPLSNPVDLFLASRACLDAGNAVKARDLLLLGGVRGRFDTRRVVDRTAWPAVIAAQREIFAPLDDDASALLTGAMAELENRSAMKAMCRRMIALGAPTYFPAYMVDHGRGASAGRRGRDALVPQFRAEEAWPRAVRAYFACDEAEAGTRAAPPH